MSIPATSNSEQPDHSLEPAIPLHGNPSELLLLKKETPAEEKLGNVYTNLGACIPAEQNSLESNGSCKIDPEPAYEHPNISIIDSSLNGIGQHDK